MSGWDGRPRREPKPAGRILAATDVTTAPRTARDAAARAAFAALGLRSCIEVMSGDREHPVSVLIAADVKPGEWRAFDADLARETLRSIIGRGHYDLFPDIPDRWRDIHRRGSCA